MKYEDYIAIETPVKYRFQNNKIPEIVPVIRDYLFEHKDKCELFFKNKIDVEALIKHISLNKELQNNPNIEPKDLMKVILEYVEGLYANRRTD